MQQTNEWQHNHDVLATSDDIFYRKGDGSKITGIVCSYYQNGDMQRICKVIDGLLDDIIKYYETEEEMLNTKGQERMGIKKWYHEKDTLLKKYGEYNEHDNPYKGIIEVINLAVKIDFEFHGSDEVWIVTPYKDGKGEGIEKEYSYESGKLRRETPYINGEIAGTEKVYHNNGKLWSERPYKDGKLEGIEKHYYDDGILNRETRYQRGIKEGIQKEYDENGKLLCETPFKYGEREGIFKSYYKNGKIQFEIPYKFNDFFEESRKEGIEKWYYESGEIRRETPYKDGNRVGIEKHYDKSIELI